MRLTQLQPKARLLLLTAVAIIVVLLVVVVVEEVEEVAVEVRAVGCVSKS